MADRGTSQPLRPTAANPARASARASVGASVGVLALLLAAVPIACSGCDQENAASKDAAEADAPPRRSRGTQVVFLGDTMMGGGESRSVLKKKGLAYALEKVRPLTEGAEFVIVNQESPLSHDNDQWNPEQKWHYNASPESAKLLAELGITAASLGNNHLFDRGPEGIADTKKFFAEAGVAVFGGGMNFAEALEPHVFETRYGKVAVVGLGEKHLYTPPATAGSPGTVLYNDENLSAAYTRAKALGADLLVAYVHWGDNYKPVGKDQKERAEAMVTAGFDLVVGHGPHIPQGVEFVGGIPVIYSLGNFVFGTLGRYPDKKAPGYGVVLRSFLTERGFERFEFTCLLIDNSKVRYQPKVCPPEEAQKVLTGLHDKVEYVDGLGVLQMPEDGWE